MPVDPVSEGVQVALGLGEDIAGFVNKGNAKAEAAELARTRPKYQIQKEFGENVDLASSELSNGMSADAKRTYDNQATGSESNSLSAILKGGGGVNSVGAIYGAGESGRENLSVIRDNMRLNQIQNLIAQRQAMAQEKTTQWQVNEYDPWKDKAQANAEARKGADDQIWGGLGTIGSGVMQAAQNNHEETMYGLKNPTTSTPSQGIKQIDFRQPVEELPRATPQGTENGINDMYFPFTQKSSLMNISNQPI